MAGTEYFHEEFPSFVKEKEPHINTLELLTVVVACKLWGSSWTGKKILIQCDNEATVTVINSGRCRDIDMLKLLRELRFHTATLEFRTIASLTSCPDGIWALPTATNLWP